MLGGVTNQAEYAFDGPAKVFMVGDDTAAVGQALGVAVMLVDVDQVDVAGDIELARSQLSHPNDPKLYGLAFWAQGSAMASIQLGPNLGAGAIQRQLCQLGDRLGDDGKRSALLAVQSNDALHHQLAQYA